MNETVSSPLTQVYHNDASAEPWLTVHTPRMQPLQVAQRNGLAGARMLNGHTVQYDRLVVQ